jgi:hypothetical protein
MCQKLLISRKIATDPFKSGQSVLVRKLRLPVFVTSTSHAPPVCKHQLRAIAYGRIVY